MSTAKQRTAAKLLALDNLMAKLFDSNAVGELNANQYASYDFASDFIPSVYSQWITNKRGMSFKQLNKIEQLYTLFELNNFDAYLNDEKIKDIQ